MPALARNRLWNVVLLVLLTFLSLHKQLTQTNYEILLDAKEKNSSMKEEPKLFNPFSDMKLSLVVTRQQLAFNNSSTIMVDQTIYSSRHCIRAQDLEGDTKVRLVTRTCHFRNLYFHPQNRTFHYFPNPHEKSILLASNGDVEASWQTLENDMTVAAGNVMRQHSKVLEMVPPTRIWHPVIERSSPPPHHYANIDNPSNLAFLLYQPYYSFNIGHFLWDDALSLFSMMDMFGLKGSSIQGPKIKGEGNHEEEKDPKDHKKVFPVPFYVDENGFDGRYYPCDVSYRNNAFKERWEKCTKMYHRMFPFMFRCNTHRTGDILRSGNWLKGEDQEWRGFQSTMKMKNHEDGMSKKNAEIDHHHHHKNLTMQISTKNSTTDYGQHSRDSSLQRILAATKMPDSASFVRIPTAVAGMGRLGQHGCDGDCMIGRASQLYSFQEFLLGNILWPDYNSIQFQKKAEGGGPAGYITFSLPVGSSRPDEVSFFENIIPIARTLYGEEKVKVLDMATVSAREEAMIALDTAILFVNHGGGSATSIFLSRDASVFLYTAGSCGGGQTKSVWCEDDKKNHLDSIFYNSNGYVRPQWIEVGDRNNTEKIKILMQNEYEQTMDSWSGVFDL